MPAQQLLNLAIAWPDFSTTLLTVLGIGLVVFVHELGHFLCALWVGVRVEVFSLGFGPRLCGVRRSGTDYRLSLVPIGGYVKMAGDAPGEGEGQKDELLARSVGEKALIYSGGVAMNMLFALVVFPIIFTVGVPMDRPAAGHVTPGGPAWRAGIEEGDEILEINGNEILGFTDVVLEVALCDPDATEMLIRRNGEERLVSLRPEYDESRKSYAIGISQPTDYRVVVTADGPAARAGLRDGDRITAIDGQPVREGLLRSLSLEDAVAVRLTVDRDGDHLDLEILPTWVEAADAPLIGVRAYANRVSALRGVLAAAGAPLAAGDWLLALDGQPVRDMEDLRALLAARPEDAPCRVRAERSGVEFEAVLDPPRARALLSDLALSVSDDASEAVPVRVIPGSPAALAGLADGTRVRAVNGVATRRWKELQREVQRSRGDALSLTVEEDAGERTLALTPVPQQRRDFGFDVESAQVERRYGLGKAFIVGMRASWNLTRQAYLTLRKMLTREVSPENLGGIVAIGHVSYKFAERGLAMLCYFLALLSINLAVINLLPIPILDGGHLTFLLIERIKGSPVSDRVLGYSQVFGLMVIVSLLIFVTFNDIRRLIE